MNPKDRSGQNWIAQNKSSTGQSVQNRPYVAQAKMPAAPAVYRPQPIPKCLQTKMAVGQQHSMDSPGKLAAGFPRQIHTQPETQTRSSVAQTKKQDAFLHPVKSPSAPPVYRPQPVPRVLQGKMPPQAAPLVRQNKLVTVALNKSGQSISSRIIQRALGTGGGPAPGQGAPPPPPPVLPPPVLPPPVLPPPVLPVAPALKTLAEVEKSVGNELNVWVALVAKGRAIDDPGTVYNTGFNGPGNANEIMSAADHKTLSAKWEKIGDLVIGADTVPVVYRVAGSRGATIPGADVFDYLCKKRKANGASSQGGFNFHIGVKK